MEIHEKLKILRLCKGWSQDDMAEKLGYSLNGYAKIERGETELKVDKLEKIAETVGVNLQQLLGMNEKNVFNLIDNFSSQHGNIYLSETQCVYELEKSNLLLKERDKEIENLKQQIAQLQEINRLLKGEK
jgi:transcriptional regulator with XRE-family HTH domain